jgi:hypothetical protein
MISLKKGLLKKGQSQMVSIEKASSQKSSLKKGLLYKKFSNPTSV